MIVAIDSLPEELEYVSDDLPGLRRRKTRTGFRYVDARGKPVRDDGDVRRIRRLAIPPAWTDVWISPSASGHLQATGRDARGRKQYRYHALWREVRDQAKYEHVLDFGAALPALRRKVDEDLKASGLTRDKVLATVVRLLELTLIRVGNEEYSRTNKSFGLTTLRKRHIHVDGSKLRFEFRGKSGKQHRLSATDRRVARIVKRCQELRGQQLFQYIDGAGDTHRVTSDDVNAYIKDATGGDFTAKDFRTWAGTVLAALALNELEPVGEHTTVGTKKDLVRVVEAVSQHLGNTPAICRKCYIHPAIFDAYTEGDLLDALACDDAAVAADDCDLTPQEAAVLELLRKRLKAQAKAAAAAISL